MSRAKNFEQWWALHSKKLLTAAANGNVLETKRLAADCWSAGLAELEVQLANETKPDIFNQISPKIQTLYHFSFQVTS